MTCTWLWQSDVDVHEWSGSDGLFVLGENKLVLSPEVWPVWGKKEALVEVLPEVGEGGAGPRLGVDDSGKVAKRPSKNYRYQLMQSLKNSY